VDKETSGSQAVNIQNSGKKEEGLAEIIVTAQKRAERLSDVPISMDVVTAGEISQRGLVGAADYLRGMPGVNEMAGAYGDTIVIRGIETSPGYEENFASGSPVATYFGETPTGTSAGMAGGSNIDIKLVDIARVEVLRGPQGTAFGDSSLGGAVRVIPAAPKLDQFEGLMSAGYSDTTGTGGDNYNYQAILNVPLIDGRVAIRAVGYTFSDTGFVRDVAASDPKFAAYSGQVGQQVADADHVGDTTFNGARVAVLYQATDDFKITASYLRQTTEIDGQPHSGTSDQTTEGLATLGPYGQALPDLATQQETRGQKLGILLTDIRLSNLTADYDLGWADLLATGSYIDSSSTSVIQVQIPGFPSQRGVGPHHETDDEIRLVSKLDGAWNFLAGLYYQNSVDRLLSDYWWFESPAVELTSFGTANPDMGYYFDRRALQQKAAYGEVSWKFLPDFTLTGGTRLYRYERSDQVLTAGPIFGSEDSPSTASASGSSWRANLSYKPNDAALIYATWSQGFRLGKPQPGLPQAICGDPNGIVSGTEGTTNVSIASTRIVNSDTIANYELGTKLSFLDRRLSISADVFRMDWDGLPVSVNAPTPAQGGCGLSYVANAGKAKSQGVEFQASYYLTSRLRADFGTSFIDAKLAQDVPSLAAVSGDRLPGAPQTNGSFALQYAFFIAGHSAWVRADTAYVGTFYADLQETSQTKAGGYFTVGASGGVDLKPHLALRVTATNLTNNDSFVFRNFTDLGPQYGYRLRPLTIGMQVDSAF
jgi:outer membrane receptor protein involved in Fe transport